MTEQTVKFAFASGAWDFYETKGKSLGYGEPYAGCDSWYRCTRMIPVNGAR